MIKYWRQLAERIDAFTLRERGIIFGALAAVFVAFMYVFLLEPQFARSTRLSQEVAQRQGEMRSTQDQVNKLLQARGMDPDKVMRERLGSAKARLATVDAALAAAERKFTKPEQMRTVVEELLKRNRRVRLVDLATIPLTSIAEARAAAGAPAKPDAPERLIFRHGIELTVAGSYLDLLAYMQDLERLPTQLYWGALTMDAAQYPVVTMKLTVYTLSLDRAWMSV